MRSRVPPERGFARRMRHTAGTMSFRETHPLTFALLIGFGSAALLLVVVFAVGFAVGF
jgi:hypothetical protein